MLDFYVQPEDDEDCRIYKTVHRNDLQAEPSGMADPVAQQHRCRDSDSQSE